MTSVLANRKPAAARRENPAVMGVPISHPDKDLWPDASDKKPVSKLELARYYEAAASFMMPHVEGRPCSIVRAPDGIDGEKFFQRHAAKGTPSLLGEVKVLGDHKPYLRVDGAQGLIAIAQWGGLEIHPWNSRPNTPDVPGRVVFDLDPAPDVNFGLVIEAALELKNRLSELGLIPFCKTTGGKGLHVVTPLPATLTWADAKSLSRAVCAAMAADSPKKYLVTMAKKDRGGRIFLDYLRNDRTATAVAPLSPRARPGATVSMPLSWSQVKKGLDPKRFTIRTALSLLSRSKAWNDYAKAERSAGNSLRAVRKLLEKA